MTAKTSVSKFETGEIALSQGALNTLSSEDVMLGLVRHLCGNWGELEEHDRRVNEDALQYGGRLISRYRNEHDTVYWVITEADRSRTTVLLPEEY